MRGRGGTLNEGDNDVKYTNINQQMTLEGKCYLLSGKNFWETRSVERLGVPSMTLADGPHGIRKQQDISH